MATLTSSSFLTVMTVVLDGNDRRHDAAHGVRHAAGGDHRLHRIGHASGFQSFARFFLGTATTSHCLAQRGALLAHLGDDQIAKLAGRHLGSAVHLAGEVVGHGLIGDDLGQRGFDQIGGFLPPHVLQHHHAG